MLPNKSQNKEKEIELKNLYKAILRRLLFFSGFYTETTKESKKSETVYYFFCEVHFNRKEEQN